ncbi:hypothetical protein BRAS3843_1220003 [Bradyrhizobium sp. STM 3843]|nr:hypothetical protein BRAS3843_1220003 [Bradyrhizobium sp. STM 3843]
MRFWHSGLPIVRPYIRSEKVAAISVQRIRMLEDVSMDRLERVFGANLDGGDGSSEALIVFTCTFILAAAVVLRAPVFRERIRLVLRSWRIRP